MSAGEFAQIAAQAAPLVDEVFLHVMGEPLMHPELERILETCGAHGLRVNLVTNGTLLDDKRLELALHSCVRQVNISLHSFAANFEGGELSAYMERIFAFTRAALARRSDLYINLRSWDLARPNQLTDGKSADLRRYLKEEFKLPWDDIAVDVRRCKHIKLGGRIYLHFDTRFIWPSLELPEGPNRGFCHGMTSHFGVLADGTVVPCCLDKEGIINLGNCKKEPLAQILAAPRAALMREGFMLKELVEPLCRRCPFIMRFKKIRKKDQEKDRD